MRTRDTIRAGLDRMMTAITLRRANDQFVCGDCERWERCGRPPSDDCVIKAAQMARDADRPKKRLWLSAC